MDKRRVKYIFYEYVRGSSNVLGGRCITVAELPPGYVLWGSVIAGRSDDTDEGKIDTNIFNEISRKIEGKAGRNSSCYSFDSSRSVPA